MKKIFILILALLTALCFVACEKEEEGNNDQGGNEENLPTTVTYTVKVMNGETPISGAKVSIVNLMTEDKKLVTTDANGVATYEAEAGMYSAELFTVPGVTDFDRTPKTFDATKLITFDLAPENVELITYTIYVKDENGNPIDGVQVQICDTVCRTPKTTDSNGMATDSVPAGNWKAQLTDVDGYHYFDENNTVTIVIPSED